MWTTSGRARAINSAASAVMIASAGSHGRKSSSVAAGSATPTTIAHPLAPIAFRWWRPIFPDPIRPTRSLPDRLDCLVDTEMLLQDWHGVRGERRISCRGDMAAILVDELWTAAALLIGCGGMEVEQ